MYIGNEPYSYPDYSAETVNTGAVVRTGWHVLANQLMSHYMTPAQWADLIDNSSTYQVTSVKMQLFNLVPLTETLSLSGTNTLWTFNNCLYALGYSDEYRETNYYNWMSYGSTIDAQTKRQRLTANNAAPNLFYKEGKQASGGSNWIQYSPPIYTYMRPLFRINSTRTMANSSLNAAGVGVYPCTTNGTDHAQKQPAGLIWDPFNNPDALMELRPGKNEITFQHTFENAPKFNSDMFAYTAPYTTSGPYQGNDRPGCFAQTDECDPDMLTSRMENSSAINDFTIPNYAYQPVVPSGWWWKELKESIMDTTWLKKPNLHWAGTEREMCCEPPPQWFVKVMPLFRASPIGSAPTLIDCIANVAVRTTISFNTTPRRSAIYCPTHGPYSWWDLYSHLPWYMNFKGAAIRARAGGMRRTWQNYEFTTVGEVPGLGSADAHRREDPYKESVTITSGSGLGGTYTITTATAGPRQQDDHTEITHTTTGTQPVPKTRWYHHLRQDLKRTHKEHDNPTFTMEEED